MSKFEEIGVAFQYNATNALMANKSFEYSCHKCCTQGRHLSCSNCAIATAHDLIVQMFSH